LYHLWGKAVIADLLEIVIARLVSDADLNLETEGRVASKHKFGLDAADDEEAWPLPSKALTVSYAPGGAVDLYGRQQRSRLEARCYGASQEEANRVYGALAVICDASERTVVATDRGNGLLYWLVLDDSPEHLKDGDLNIDLARVSLRACCHRNFVP
jgi:hypothetical protein